MADSVVRSIAADEVLPWLSCMGTAFFRQADPGFAAWWAAHTDLDRVLGAFEHDTVVATARSFGTELTVPGPAVVRASALTNVSVLPTHRRRGLLTSLMHAQLEAAASRGEAVGYLVASEWPIYGRFGYGPATEACDYRVDTRAARFLRPPSGRVELVGENELARLAPAIYERVRRDIPGAVERPPWWWERNLGGVEPPEPGAPPRLSLLQRDPSGEPAGFALYRVEPSWEAMRSSARLTVEDLVAATPDAYHALWSYCCSMDLAGEVTARRRPVDEALPLLLADGRAARRADSYDVTWVRVLDVPAALGGRGYQATGSLVLEVTDVLGFAAGVFCLDAGPGGASCEPSEQEPDLCLGAGALGSLYLGGMAAERLAVAGLVRERSPGAVALASALFRTPVAPWCATWF